MLNLVSLASLFHSLVLNQRIKLQEKRSLVLTPVGSQDPVAHPGTALHRQPAAYMLQKEKENGIFLKRVATCEACLVHVFLKQHVSTYPVDVCVGPNVTTPQRAASPSASFRYLDKVAMKPHFLQNYVK